MKKIIPAGVIISIIFVILLIGCAGPGRKMNCYLYVACDNAGAYSVSSFKIEDSTGTLTPIAETPPELYSEITSMKADHQGNRVYIIQNCISTISISSIDPNTGELFPRATPAVDYIPQSLAIDPTDRFLYSTSNTSGYISFFNANDTLNPIAAPRPVDSSYDIAFSPLGNCCYITKYNLNTLMILKYNPKDGQVYDTWESTNVTTSGLTRPTYVVVHPNGQYIYVANDVSVNNMITGFKLIGDPNRIEPLAPVQTSYTKLLLTMDPAGRYLYAAGLDGTKLTIYGISSGTGELTKLNELDTFVSIKSIAATPNGKYVYVSDYGEHEIIMFKVTNDAAVLNCIGTFITNTGCPGAMTLAWKLQ
jgi:6-phosphogluconolactonase (cycloisomerase 2 family)